MKIEPGDDLGVYWRRRPLNEVVSVYEIQRANRRHPGVQTLFSALTPPHEVCAMLRNYLKYFVMIPILHIFSEMHPRAGFPGVPTQ